MAANGNDRPAIAIDPGRGKCGLAVVHRSGTVAEQAVVPREKLLASILDAVERHNPVAVVIGDRTGSKAAKAEIQPCLSVPIVTVAEHETTLRARERYYRDHPHRGLAALIPLGMRTPPRPIDDYAAILLAEKYWEGKR